MNIWNLKWWNKASCILNDTYLNDVEHEWSVSALPVYIYENSGGLSQINT